MISDPIADMITRIRNGYLSKKGSVNVPKSRFKEEVAKILVDLGYLESLEVTNPKESFPILELTLKYKNGVPALNAIDRISKPSLRIYKNHTKLPVVLSGMGQAIVSTSQGLMTSRDAKKKKLGGEIVLRVY